MSRYIDAEDLEKAIRKKTNAIEVEDVLAEISNAPSIVTCKNCRHRKMKRTKWRGEPYLYYVCEELERVVEDDDYCSWGEEK